MEPIDLDKRERDHWERLCHKEGVTIDYCGRIDTNECPSTCEYYRRQHE